MPGDVVQPIPVLNLVVPRGGTRIVRFTIAKDAANADLSLPNTGVVFTAKRRDNDAAALISKSYGSAGWVRPAGVTAGGIAVSKIDTNADAVLDTWVADVTINPADTETIDLTLLHYDLWFFDPSGQEAPCAQGTLKLSPTVLRP